MKQKPDVEVLISFLKTEDGGRKYPVRSGYRPAHQITDDYLTSGSHYYFEKEEVSPGESVIGTITFITPEVYPNSLWVGKKINFQEGSHIIGNVVITKIFNQILLFESKE